MTEKHQPTYDELRETLLYLGGPEEDDRFLIREALDRLLSLGMLYKRGPKHIDLTDLGEAVYDRLRAGGDAPELRV